MELAPAGLVMTGLVIRGLAMTGLVVAGLASGELARAGLATVGPAITGVGSSGLPGTRHTAARAGPGLIGPEGVRLAPDGIQRANRPPRQRVLRADFIAAPSR
ncbi:MAG: hypothetical protein ACR2MP_35075 [Streptosporangiaceae bacterium]